MIFLQADVGLRDSNAGSGYNRGKIIFRVRTMYSSFMCLLPTEEEKTSIHGTNAEEIQKKLVPIAASDFTPQFMLILIKPTSKHKKMEFAPLICT